GNLTILAFGLFFASVAQFLFLLPFIGQKEFTYRATINFKDPHIKEMLYLALPVLIGVAVNDINAIVDKTMASQIYEGGISVLNYALRLNGFVQGIVVLSIAVAMYPLISKMAAEDNISGLKKTLSEAITGIGLLVIPCTVGAMVLAEPIIALLFGRGAFDEQAIVMTASALFFYAIGMIGIGLRQVLSRSFYALQDTKTPMINAAIGMVLNVTLNIILSRFLGIGGLALATSISAMIMSILLVANLRHKIGALGFKKITLSFIKILFASVVMGVIARGCFSYLTITLSQNLSLLAAMAVGALSYFVIIYFMKIEDVDAVVKAVREKIGETIG
ncbi:MAG: murein biosynthesis integral membrane protein MurJ, partial [Dethiobacteria bacterium]